MSLASRGRAVAAAATARARSVAAGSLRALLSLRRYSSQADDALAEKRRVGVERFVQRLVWLFVPPREHRIVTVVEGVPIAQGISQDVHRADCSKRHSLLDLDRVSAVASQSSFNAAARIVDLFL